MHEDASSGNIYDFKTGQIAQLSATQDAFAAAIDTFERDLDAEILRRLVVLNAERAADEKRGIIHWLRPEYQNPQGTEAPSLDLQPSITKQKLQKVPRTPLKLPWPKALADRIRTVEHLLHKFRRPVSASLLAERLARAKEKDVLEILETLVSLGRAHSRGDLFSP
jgi:hypothetical protein